MIAIPEHIESLDLKHKIMKMQKELYNSYKRYKNLYIRYFEKPNCSNRLNVNITISHIIQYKIMCVKLFQENFIYYPDEFWFPVPEILYSEKNIKSYNETLKFDFEKELKKLV